MKRVRQFQCSPQAMSEALAATSDVVVVVDVDRVIGYASPATERVLGRGASQWSNRTIDEFVHPDDRETIRTLLADAPSGRSLDPVRVRAARADGRWANLEATRLEAISPTDDAGAIVVLRDVTALVETERDLDVARAEYDLCAPHDAVTGSPDREQPGRLDDVLADDLGEVSRDAPANGLPSFSMVVGERDEHDRCCLADDVAGALAAGDLELHYQPIRDIHSGRIAGFEGLLRWKHADGGVVTAADFLPAVEGTALIVDIGDFVLEQGCAQLAKWQRRYGTSAPSLALNVSARQLRQGDFASRVRMEISRSGADSTGLCLELTETHALEGEPRALAELERVRKLGASVALDDFGTGYSSLHQLQRIAADVLKIDRSFIKKVGIDRGATAIVRAAIDLGAAFDMTTVAEGVTTVEQHRLLLSMGCDRIQGFLIAPALPADLAESMLRSERARDPLVGFRDADNDVDVLRAHGRLALIDARYVSSEDEVAALAGVTALDARRGLMRAAQSVG